MSVSNLAFPCVAYGERLKFESLLITNETYSTRSSSSVKQLSLKVERSSSGTKDQFKALLNELSINQPLSYIENNPLDEDESYFPLLIKVLSHFDSYRLCLTVDYSKAELDQMRDTISEKAVIFEDLLVVKVKNDNDLETAFNNIKTNTKVDNVRSVGSINILPATIVPVTQSLLSGKSNHNYAFPSLENPVRISTSLPIRSSDSGKEIIYVLNKSQNRIEKLLRFAFWKDQTVSNVPKEAIASASKNIHQKMIDFETESYELPLTDGPAFRQLVSNFEEKISQSKLQLAKVVVNGKTLINCLNATAEAKLNFINSFKVFAVDNRVLNKLIDGIIESFITNSANADEQLLNSLKKNILSPLSSIPASNNINALSSNKKIFEEESQRYYSWLTKYLGSGKSKDEKFLEKRKAFELAKFDYLSYLNEIANNNTSTLELTTHLMAFINNIDKSRSLALPTPPKEIQKKLDKEENERRSLRKRIGKARTDEELDETLSVIDQQPSDSNSLHKAGLLYTYGGQGKQGWHKQWIVLNNSSLVEYSDWRKCKDRRGSLIDISLCSIKPVTHEKRKNCFEIITSKGLKNVYQATSEAERDSWIKALYDAGQIIRFGSASDKNVANGHRRRVSSVSLKNLQLVQNLDKSNLTCCDCGSAEGVEWISLNLLIIICVQCSSSHRNLGTSISKVRSLKLDNFSNEQVSLISHINNGKSNQYFEDKLTISKIKPNSSDQERLEFISFKYKEKLFLKSPPPGSLPNNILLHGLKDRNFNEMLWALALRANIGMSLERNGQEFSFFEYSLTKPLKDSKSEVYDIAEFLILNSLELPAEIHNSLLLSDSALKYWNDKIEKIYGSTKVPEVLKENVKTSSSNNGDRKVLKVNTTVGTDDNVLLDKKITSPSSATARYSRNLIKKITTNNNTSANGHSHQNI